MLQDLIREVLSDMKYTVNDIEEKSGSILTVIKDLAKKLFLMARFQTLRILFSGTQILIQNILVGCQYDRHAV